MKKEIFTELLESIQQGGKIVRGKTKIQIAYFVWMIRMFRKFANTLDFRRNNLLGFSV